MTYKPPSPSEWYDCLSGAFDRPAKLRLVERHVRDLLAARFPDILQTGAVVEELWPERYSFKSEDVRASLFSLLGSLAKGSMVDCVSKGDERPGKGPFRNRMVRPTLWHSPDAKPAPLTCKACGQVIP
jgi:hypothetical protein